MSDRREHMLEARGIAKSFGALKVANNVTLELDAGERRAIIGPNGAGKTTLFNLLTGEIAPDAGTVLLDQKDITRLTPDARARRGLGRSFQKNNLFRGLTVRESLTLSAMIALGKARQFWRDPGSDVEIAERIDQTAQWVNLAGELDLPTDALSYGARRQLEVGLALAARPKVLLLDEPTSGMSPEDTGIMLELLNSLPSDLAMLIIEHDMDLVYGAAQRVTVLNYGEIVFEGTPEEARASDEVKRIYLGDWGDHHA
ncbi:MAG: ABC transporter ATP-binding protein [Hyphomicrobiaceae bacterium]